MAKKTTDFKITSIALIGEDWHDPEPSIIFIDNNNNAWMARSYTYFRDLYYALIGRDEDGEIAIMYNDNKALNNILYDMLDYVVWDTGYINNSTDFVGSFDTLCDEQLLLKRINVDEIL